MPLHIGIIGCSAEGAALCYRTICEEGSHMLGGYAHPEVSMHTPSLAGYVHCLEHADMNGIAALMLTSAKKLAAAGAELLICPDNTIHQAYPLLKHALPRPFLHIAEVVAAEAADRGYRRVGILGTRWLVDSHVYPQALTTAGLDYARPAEEERVEVGRIIMKELVHGIFKPESVDYARRVIQHLADRGCDSVVLGCTELPLILSDDNAALPTLDSTRLLARAALAKALATRAGESMTSSAL